MSARNSLAKFFVLLLALALLSACATSQVKSRDKGALIGTAVGSGIGAIIGNRSGRAGEGVAIGAAIGALSGGFMGNSKDKENARFDRTESQIRQQEVTIAENQRIISELKSGGLDSYQDERGIVTNLPDVLFNFNQANLSSSARGKVTKIADVLRRYEDRQALIAGHTDSLGNSAYNLALSEDRAQAVRSALLSSGINDSRLRARGYGEDRPIADNQSSLGRQKNRRVEVIIE